MVKKTQLDEPLVAYYPKRYDDFVLYEAQHGHPDPLISRLSFFLQNGGEPLTKGEIEFVVKTLRATTRKRGKDELRKFEQFLIASGVESLVKEGEPRKAAIAEVMSQHHRSERHVKSALSAQGKRVRKKR